MISPELLKIICCPETHQELELAGHEWIKQCNERISRGEVTNRGGKKVEHAIEGALVRKDRRFAYPIREGIPVMLIDDGLPC